MTWPPPTDAPFWNKPKKEQAEYEAVVERDGCCVECGGAWGEFHHVLYGKHKRVADRNNMVLLCKEPCHGEGPKGAHGPNAKAKREKYLAYLEGK